LTAEIAGQETPAAGAEAGSGTGGARRDVGGASAPTGGPPDEAQYERLLDGLPGGTYVVRDGSFVYANATFAQTVGYQPEQLTGGMGMADLCNEVRSEIGDKRPEDQDEGIVTYQVSGERAMGGEFTLGIRERREELDGESVVIGLALDLSE
jgi:PAS domain S-box-containing protein